jgi:hypothetical protein
VRLLVGRVRAAAPADRTGHIARRVSNEATIVLGQRKLLQRFLPGLMHAFIFWGFIVLLPTILIAMIGIVDRHATLPWLGHQGWYALLDDLFAVLVLVGVVAALYIRKVVRPRRFQGSHLGEADLILGLIATIAVSLLLWHAARIALGLNDWPRADQGAGARVRVDPRAHDPRFPGLPAALQAPPHRLGRLQRVVRPHRPGRPAGAAGLRGAR